jgi:hypothetical protein
MWANGENMAKTAVQLHLHKPRGEQALLARPQP